MECSCRWATLYLLIYLTLNVANVFSQNILVERKPPEVVKQTQNLKNDITRTPGPSKAQLINALFSYASAKGLLPKTTQIIQSTPNEQPRITTSQNEPRVFNVGQLQPHITSNCENRLIVASTPSVSVNPVSNQAPPSMMNQPTLRTESVSWASPPQTSQVGCLANSASFPPTLAVWHIPQSSQATEINSYPPNQPAIFNNAMPPYANLQISPTNCVPPKITPEFCTVENVNTNFKSLLEEPIAVTSDDKEDVPINLQINIPSPNDLYPRLTIVTAAPTNSDTGSTFPPYAFPPHPPIIIKRSRSCLRNLLPIILLTLADSGGGCGCPCNCDSDPVPVPYPIPIPMNNPIIHSASS